jgi:hypothetical protein
MLQKNPLFLFPISYFGSAQQFDQELSEEEEVFAPETEVFPCGFVLELEKPDPFPEKIGSFLLWTEISTIAVDTDYVIDDSIEFLDMNLP